MKIDHAWENDNGKTNRLLCDGDRVELITPTLDGPSSYQVTTIVPPGSLGTVAHARTPRVFGGGVFANVDLDGGTRVRVPHNALNRVKS